MEILSLRNENSRLTYCCYLVICITPFMVIIYLLIKGLWIIYQKSQNEVILPNTFSLWFILAQKTMESLIFESFDTIFYDITEMSWKQPWTLKKTMVGDRIHRDSGLSVLTGFWQDVSPFEVWQFDKSFLMSTIFIFIADFPWGLDHRVFLPDSDWNGCHFTQRQLPFSGILTRHYSTSYSAHSQQLSIGVHHHRRGGHIFGNHHNVLAATHGMYRYKTKHMKKSLQMFPDFSSFDFFFMIPQRILYSYQKLKFSVFKYLNFRAKINFCQ